MLAALAACDGDPDERFGNGPADDPPGGAIVYASVGGGERIEPSSGRTGAAPDALPPRRASATGETAAPNGDTIEIRDVTGAVTAVVETGGPAPDRVVLSPSAQLVAYTQVLSVEGGFERASSHVLFARRDGTALGRHGPDCRDVEWLLDDRALLACDDRILLVDPASRSTPTLLRAFHTDAEPINLVLSPDGTAIAFELGPRAGLHNNVHRMSVDGSTLVRLVDGGFNTNTDAAAWSPDGRWIAFREDIPYAAIEIGLSPDDCPRLWIVRSDVVTTVDLDEARTGIDTRAFEVRRAPDGDSLCVLGPPRWIP